jgi:peroxiredoxin
MTLNHLLALTLLTVGLTARADSPVAPKPDKPDAEKHDDHADHIKIKTDANQPALAPKPVKKVVDEVKISPEAKAELEQVTAAYKKLTSLDLAGTLTREIDTGSESVKHQAILTASFLAPNMFRHEIKDTGPVTQPDMIIGSTGEKVFAFRPARNDFKAAEAPTDRLPSSKVPQPARALLEQQNPALMCAIVDDAGKFLTESIADDTKEVAREPDITLNGKPAIVLNFKADKVDYKVLLDPDTHLLRQIILDYKRILTATLPEAKKDLLTYDYATIKPNDPATKSEAFAWAVPEGAKDAGAASAGEGDAMALVNQDAPDFKLKGMDGKPVSLADFKGQVVILDFWATWCGPCQASLPGLNKIHKELKAKGLQTFAVDLEESKDTIQPVAAQLCPDIPVLLDEESKVAGLYGVNGIPQTVVIGRDGKVKKVFIGAGNESNIRSAAESLLEEK